jgi:hypothetical protein
MQVSAQRLGSRLASVLHNKILEENHHGNSNGRIEGRERHRVPCAGSCLGSELRDAVSRV